MSQTMLVRLFITFLIILLSLNYYVICETTGSKVEVYKKNGELVKGELLQVDSNNIILLIRLPKSNETSTNYLTKNLATNLCDSVIIPGAFTGASPYIISSVLGVGTTGVLIGSSKNPNYYISGAIGAIIGFFSYVFIESTLTYPEIRFTEIDKYPWKLKPYSRNYKSN